MPCLKRCLLSAAVLGLMGPARAELTVVADVGGQPAKPFYVAIKGAGVSEKAGYQGPAHRREGPIHESYFLPIRSKKLSPGIVKYRSIDLPPVMARPFFIIGTDQFSRRWLKARGAKLRELHAVGLVVDVEDSAGLQRLRELGVPLRKLSPDEK